MICWSGNSPLFFLAFALTGGVLGEFDVFFKTTTRRLLSAMVEKIPTQDVLTRDELVPQADGDIRDTGYSWLRSAVRQSRINRVPREAQVRLVVQKLVRKAELCNLPRIL